jgi:uncharacterized protein (TIGR03000 family)
MPACFGRGCHGCFGGGHGCHGGFFGRRHGRHGCHGGCHGGCYGGCNGCYGGCNGGCYGGCNGGCVGYSGCCGCTGAAVETPPANNNDNGKGKDNNNGNNNGNDNGNNDDTSARAKQVSKPITQAEEARFQKALAAEKDADLRKKLDAEWKKADAKGKRAILSRLEGDDDDDAEETSKAAAPATLVVTLPADATLLIDGKATRSTSALRVFASPKLMPGKAYYYTLTAKVVRNGRTITTTKRVRVHPGVQTRVSMEPAASMALNK